MGSFPTKFTDLIAPMTETEYFAKYFAKRPFSMTTGARNGGRPIFGPDELLAHVGCREPKGAHGELDFRVVRDAQDLPEMFLLNKGHEPINRWFPPLFADGWTLNASRVQSSSVPVEVVAALVSDAVQANVWVNVYYTPANAFGFKFHHDTHDVFIWQQTGAKSWKIWERNATPDDPPLIETILRPGELLYIPEGFPHLAEAGAGEDSLHLTIAFFSRWTRIKKQLTDRLNRWSAYLSEDLAALTGKPKSEAMSPEEVRAGLKSFQRWLETDLEENPPGGRRSAMPELTRSVGELLDDLHRLNQDARIRMIRDDPDYPIQSRHRQALAEAGRKFTVGDLSLDPTDALLLCRLLINSGRAEIDTQ